MTRTKRLLIPVISLALAALPVLAQDNAPKTAFRLTLGTQGASGINDSSKLQEYEVIKRGLVIFDAAFDWHGAKGGYLRFAAKNLGLDDQSASLAGGNEGFWKLSLTLDQNPRWFSNTGATLYSQSMPGTFKLADGMRDSLQRIWSPWRGTGSTEPAAPANSNDNRFWSFRDYLPGAQPVDLRYVRKTSRAGFEYTGLKDWAFSLALQRENRNGTEPVVFTGTGGPGIIEIAQTIDYRTDELKAGVDFAHGRIFANGSVSYNNFTNGVPYSTIDNPQRLMNVDYYWNPTARVNYVTGSNSMRLWNAPDNKALTFDLTGGISLPLRHTVTANFQMGRMSMARDLIAQSTNPNLATSATNPDPNFTLAPEYPGINAKFDTQMVMLRLTGAPLKGFGYSASFRTYELKDKMEEYVFHSTVNRDGSGSYSSTGLATRLSGYKTDALKGEVHYSFIRGFRVGLNLGQKKTSYAEREYLSVTDRTIGVTLDANVKWAGFRGAYSSADRTPGAFNPEGPATYVRPYRLAEDGVTRIYDLGNQPGFFMTDLTKRKGRVFNAALTLSPVDRLAATFFCQGFDNDYPDTDVGLKKMTATNFGADLVWAVTEQFSINAGLIDETYKMDNNFWYSPGNSAPESTDLVNPEDRYWNFIANDARTLSLGFRWDVLPDRLDVGSDFDYSKGVSRSTFEIASGGVLGGDINFPTNTTTVNFPTVGPYTAYPEVNNTLTIWKAQVTYHLNPQIDVGFLWWWQKYVAADYALDYLRFYMLPGSSLYAINPDGTTNTAIISTVYPNLDPSANKAYFLGATVPDYDAKIFRLFVRYRW